MLTGFAGRLNLDGRKATNDEALILAQSIPSPQGSYTAVKIHGALALAALNPFGTKGHKKKLIITENGSYILTGSGSIYNREELIIQLYCSDNSDDLELMWYAWRKWGDQAPLHLDGDWMFAAYDSQREELLLARSWGHSSLYYCRGDGFLAFATHPAALTALDGVPRKPNIKVLTQILCMQPLAPNVTCYQDIYQLQPASKMEIAKNKVREFIWWRPSNIQQMVVTDQKAVLDKFVSLYDDAVKKRLRTPMEVGVTLSAGLDSSSVCVLAAQGLLPYGKTLHAWTSVPYYPEEAYAGGYGLTDESALAASAVKGIGNIRHTLADSADVDPIKAICKQIIRTGRPQGAAVNLFWIDRILLMAADSDCGILLTGQSGNNTVSWTPYNLTLFPKRRYFPHTSWSRYLKVVKYSMFNRMKQIKKSINGFGPDAKLEFPLTLNPKFVQTEIFKQSMDSVWDNVPINHASMAEVHMSLYDTWYHTGFWSGIEVRDPTMDLKLTEFMLSLPDNMFFSDGLDRRVMRLGMQGILPDEIRLNKKRGQQASDIVPRIRHFGEQAALALTYIEASGLARDLLNLQQMNLILQCVRKGESGLKVMKECASVLLPGISVGLFLATLDTELDLMTALG